MNLSFYGLYAVSFQKKVNGFLNFANTSLIIAVLLRNVNNDSSHLMLMFTNLMEKFSWVRSCCFRDF